MKISVILCTYNRCRTLALSLQSVACSVMPATVQWDVLVVDNNSNDQTRSIVDDYSQRYPNRFRYIFEPRQGKSHALNTGILEARADVLAFMDDDVVVESDWLATLTGVLNQRQWSGVGGRILPEAGFTPPQWLETNGRYALAPLAIFDLGPDAFELNEPPFGTNMAFRQEMFLKYGGFRTDLGPQPGSEIRSEDTEFGSRLLSNGERLCYEPAAVVYHPVSHDRLRQAYFLRWWFDKARADIREHGIPSNTKWYVAGVPLFLLRRLCAWAVRWTFSTSSRQRFSSKLNVWKAAGMIQECRRRSVSGAQSPSKEPTSPPG